jgi:hypothetical protein
MISTYSNEITHIYICMKLERHKDSNLFLKRHKGSKRHWKK